MRVSELITKLQAAERLYGDRQVSLDIWSDDEASLTGLFVNPNGDITNG